MLSSVILGGGRATLAGFNSPVWGEERESETSRAVKVEVKYSSVMCKTGCLNVREINDDTKQVEIEDMIKVKKLDLAELT